MYINLLRHEISSNTTYTKGVVWEVRQGSGHLFHYSEYGNQILGIQKRQYGYV